MKLKFLKTKLPTVLTIISCVGVVATAISSSKAAIKAEKKEDTVDKVLVYIPTVAIATGTMACICGSNYINRKRQMTLAGALTMLNAEYARYQSAVVDKYGQKAHEDILAIAHRDPCNPPDIWVPGLIGGASVLVPDNFADKEIVRTFYDEHSKRYFESTLSKVMEAEYHYNRDYCGSGEVDHNRFYEYLGLDPIDSDEGYSIDGGLWWVDFNNRLTRLDDGMEVVVIETEFAPEPPDEW